MTEDLQDLKAVKHADVYKAGVLAGSLSRTSQGGTLFKYESAYLDSGAEALAFSLPLTDSAVESNNGAVPPFFAGLLPEGHRLSMLRDATKTSLSDELTLLLAIGSDVPGDVQVVATGSNPHQVRSLAQVEDPAQLDFDKLAQTLDLNGIPGVQSKVSATMLTTPLALAGVPYILKLDPADHEHLVVNEAAHLKGARGLSLPVAANRVITDGHGKMGLLVTRFDRVAGAQEESAQVENIRRLPLEDGTQVLGLPPSVKYAVESEQVALALAQRCKAPVVALRNLYLQFVFAWLTGNGDLHAKNISVLGDGAGRFRVAPIYDIPCTLMYGDNTMALTVAGRHRKIKARHWAEFADSLGLPQRAAQAANQVALRAAAAIKLADLPFTGSTLRGAQRELSIRRGEFGG